MSTTVHIMRHINAAQRAHEKECKRARGKRANTWSNEQWNESLETRVALAEHIQGMRQHIATMTEPWFDDSAFRGGSAWWHREH